jgi:hypothetical protein
LAARGVAATLEENPHVAYNEIPRNIIHLIKTEPNALLDVYCDYQNITRASYLMVKTTMVRNLDIDVR